MAELTLEKVIPSLIKAEQHDRDVYKKFASECRGKEDLKKLFLSLAEQEDDHEKTLKELLDDPTYRDALGEPVGTKEELQRMFSMGKEKVESFSVNDLLTAVISREEGRCALYSYLSSKLTQEHAGFLLTNLAFEEKKHKNWVMDRYELEMLSAM